MYSILFYIFISFTLFLITIPVNSQDLYSPLMVTSHETYFIATNVQRYVNEVGVLTKNIIATCPSNLPSENEINFNSITKKILIVRQFLKKGRVYSGKNDDNICEKEIMPSIIWDSKYNVLRVGYEIIDAHNLIEESFGKMEKPAFFFGDSEWVQIYGISMQIQNYKFAYFSSYSADAGSALSPPDLCRKFDISDNEQVDSNRKENSQNENSEPTNENSSTTENRNVEQKIRSGTDNKTPFKILYLAEPEDFDNYYSKLSTCFEFNKTIISKSVFNEAWEKVGNFVRDVNKKLSQKGQMALLKASDGNLKYSMNEELREFLSTLKIPVPKRFWYFVSFKVEKTEIYGIFIVIHNNTYEKIDKLCENDVCEKYGWEVKNTDFRTGETYCCEPFEINTQKIKKQSFIKYKSFDLKKFL